MVSEHSLNGLRALIVGGGSGIGLASARALAAETLSDVGLNDYVDAPVSTLTVGLLKRLEVARALAMRPKLVLFDEIMAGLTPTEVGTMTRFIGSLPGRGITVIRIIPSTSAL